MTITPLSTVYANGDTFSASDINATNTAVNLVTATQSLIASKGDILTGTADDTLGKTTVGANDTILTADSAQTNGVKWSATFAGNSATASTASAVTAGNGTAGSVVTIGTGNLVPSATSSKIRFTTTTPTTGGNIGDIWIVY